MRHDPVASVLVSQKAHHVMIAVTIFTEVALGRSVLCVMSARLLLGSFSFVILSFFYLSGVRAGSKRNCFLPSRACLSMHNLFPMQ